MIFDRTDVLQDRYLRQRSRRQLHPPRHHVPGSTAFAEAVRLGLGWGMVPDLQTLEDGGLVELDPKGAIDVSLYWQQWRLSSPFSSGSRTRCTREPRSCWGNARPSVESEMRQQTRWSQPAPPRSQSCRKFREN